MGKNQEKFEKFRLRFVGVEKISQCRKKSENAFFFSKIQESSKRIAQKTQLKFKKKIRALCSEIIATRMDDRHTTDKFRFHKLFGHSQAELKNLNFLEKRVIVKKMDEKLGLWAVYKVLFGKTLNMSRSIGGGIFETAIVANFDSSI